MASNSNLCRCLHLRQRYADFCDRLIELNQRPIIGKQKMIETRDKKLAHARMVFLKIKPEKITEG
jgi:hypothetical protein